MANKPILICVGGISGSGKTTVSKAMLPNIPNVVHLDSDCLRKEFHGVPATTKLPPEAYSFAASKPFFAEMDRRIKQELMEGKNVIVSATFLSPQTRERHAEIAAETGAQFVGIWLQADLNVVFDRVAKRVNDASDAGVDIVERQAKSNPQGGDWTVIDATRPREDVLKEVLKAVAAAQSSAAVKKPQPPKPA